MTTPTKRLRHAAIGACAIIFPQHRLGLELNIADLVAICDLKEEKGRALAGELGCDFYLDYKQMLAEARPDVVSISTPHPLHAEMAIAAMRAGAHVLVEKPMAVQVADADRMIEEARLTGKILAVNFQQRLRPEVRAAKAILESGQLGKIQRVELVTYWPRSRAYYRSSDWRATWTGEGGGVLLNQAPHDLDLLYFLIGRAERVFAWNRTNFHQIEVEDTVEAMVEWPGGVIGTVHVSTAEAGIENRFEIVGTGGVVRITPGAIRFEKAEQDVHVLLDGTTDLFPPAPLVEQPVALPEGEGTHREVYRNFYAAVLEGAPLNAPGAEGVYSLELANAMVYSSMTHREVTLPLDRQEFAQLFATLQQKG